VMTEGDGSLVVTGTYRSDVLLANSVLRYGAAVELLEPKRVRRLIAEEIAALTRLYAAEPTAPTTISAPGDAVQ
jgi:predicted DNA-binding transcriptional regulator YafY